MSGERILVIDDSAEMVKHLTEYILPIFGYETLFAFDGESGLALIKEEKPDLVMLDYNLPRMTGIDVLQQMAQESLSVPVILMTGYGSELSAIEAFRLGAKDYLIKPFTVDEIVETIGRALVESRLLHDKKELAEQVRRTKAEMDRQTRQMNTLFSMGKALTALLSADKILERALDAAAELTNAEECTLWLPNQQNNGMEAYQKTGGDLQKTVVSGDTLSGSLVEQASSMLEPLRQSELTGEGLSLINGHGRAVLYVPLALRGMPVGVLSAVNRSALRRFSRQDEFLLSFLADYVAIALENARVLRAADVALAAKIENLDTLIEITRTITSSVDLDEVARLTIAQVHKSWDIEASSLWVLNEERNRLKVLASVGTAVDVLSAVEIPVDQGFIGQTITTGKWIMSNSVADDETHYQAVDQETGFKTRSLICVPLFAQNKIIGAIELINKQNGNFNDQDVAWAESIAAAVAIAIHNSLLFKMVN